MEIDETMVEEIDTEETEGLPDEVVEEEQDESEDLSSITEEEEEQPAQPEPQATEPGYIKKRIEKAVSRAVAETEARMQAMFDQQMAPIRQKMMEDEAQELVRSRKVADIETARELVRLRNGQAAAPQTASQETPVGQPRQANGQFAPRNDNDAATTAKIDMLEHQAERIKASGGPDVIEAFKNNDDIKQAVVNGEMDFYEVAELLKSQKRRPPSPMRSPNGASSFNPNAIDSMSDEQFEKMERKIKEGARYTLK